MSENKTDVVYSLNRQIKEEESGDEEQGHMTQLQLTQSVELAQHWQKLDRRRSYDEKAVFRETQKALVNKIQVETQELAASQEKKGMINIRTVLEECNEHFEKIQLRGASGKEMLLDAQILQGVANQLVTETELSLAVGMKQFVMERFADRLAAYLLKKRKETIFPSGNSLLQVDNSLQIDIKKENEASGNQRLTLNRSQLQRITTLTTIVQPSQSLSYIYGLFDKKDMIPLEKKVKKERVIKREPEEEQIVLKQKNCVEHTENEVSVSKELDFVRKCLRRALKQNGGSVSYYKFVIDPSSFGKSVENIFHTSFLIKDCYATIDLDDDGLPRIRELRQINREFLQNDESGSSVQAVLSFDKTIWKGMIEALHLTEAMIPDNSS